MDEDISHDDDEREPDIPIAETVDLPTENSNPDESSTTTDDVNEDIHNTDQEYNAPATESTRPVRIRSAPMRSKDYVCNSSSANFIPDWEKRVSMLETILLIGGLNDVEQKRLVDAILQLVTGNNCSSVTM